MMPRQKTPVGIILRQLNSFSVLILNNVIFFSATTDTKADVSEEKDDGKSDEDNDSKSTEDDKSEDASEEKAQGDDGKPDESDEKSGEEEQSGEEKDAEKSEEDSEKSGESDADKSGEEDEKSGEDDSEEEDEVEAYIPRSRDHITEILGLDDSERTKTTFTLLDQATQITLKELKRIYENAIKPLEKTYKYRDLSNRHFGGTRYIHFKLISSFLIL